MKVKKTIKFEFTEKERDLIDTARVMIEDLNYAEFNALKDVTKNTSIVEAICILWDLAFENNGIVCPEKEEEDD